MFKNYLHDPVLNPKTKVQLCHQWAINTEVWHLIPTIFLDFTYKDNWVGIGIDFLCFAVRIDFYNTQKMIASLSDKRCLDFYYETCKK